MTPRGGSSPMRSSGNRAAGTAAGGAAAGGVAGGLAKTSVQGGIVGSAEGLMTAAFFMASSAGVLLPPGLMVAFDFKLTTGKPQNLIKAAEGWQDAASKLEKAATELRQLAASIPDHAWTADDRQGYQTTADDYALQLDYLHNYCMAVSIILMGLAWALFGYAVFATGMAAYLDALAIASFTVVAYPECLALAGTAATITHVVTGVLGVLGGFVFMGLLMGGSFTAEMQGQRGNQHAKASFDKALSDGLKSGGVNLLQNAANAPLAFINRTPDATFPLKEIDLDADRNKDGEWNVGGAAKFTTPVSGDIEHELGTHHKFQNGDYKGGDVEYKAKVPLDPAGVNNVTGGGKFDWKPEKDGRGWDYGGSLNAGYENAQTGHKAGYEGGMKDGKYDDKIQVGGPQGYVERPVFSGPNEAERKKTEQQQKADETPPWHKK